LTTKPAEELDGRIAAVFSDDAKSGDAARLLAEVKEATSAAELAAETARKHALDPLLSGDDLKLARREMDDASFLRDRLTEAASRLGERVAELKALEADRRMSAEHERVLDERDRLAEEVFGRSDCADCSPCSSDRSLRTRDRAAQRNIGGEVRPHPHSAVGSSARRCGPVWGRHRLGCVHRRRGAAGAASCFRRGRREGQAARQAIRQFASDGLNRGRTARKNDHAGPGVETPRKIEAARATVPRAPSG
jgi:hypothetical protein